MSVIQSEAVKARWQNPEQRTALLAMSRNRKNNPTFIEKQRLSHLGKTYRKGTVTSDEARNNLSAAAKLLWQNPEARQKLSERSKKMWSNPEYRAAQTLNRKGRVTSAATKLKLSIAGKGRVMSEDTKKKLSLAKAGVPQFHVRGDKHWLWKGGVSSENAKARKTAQYRLWREAVFARDGWTCQECLTDGVYLNAHHLKGFADYPELRYAIDNGVSLCKPCHKKVHKEGLLWQQP